MNRDRSSVPPQGGYVAKQCPVRAQNGVLVPAVPIPAPPELQRRFDRGQEFEAAVVHQLVNLNPGAVVVVGSSSEEIEAATLEAIAAEAEVIIGARLPTDLHGHRVGKPDLLVAAGSGAYWPVDIKHHLTLEPAAPDRRVTPPPVSQFVEPTLTAAVSDEAQAARRREDDLLQLAHYQRMLEAAGLAAKDGRWGGIIGVERCVVWFDLDAPIWKTPSSTGRQKMRSTMEKYDFEFNFRLDVLAVAAEHQLDSSVPLLVLPVKVSECAECPWWEYCQGQLEAGAGDVSLLPRIGWREWKIHRDHGVRDRSTLAALDSQTARLAAAGVDITELQRLVEGLPDETPIRDLGVVVRTKSQLTRLEEEGITTFGALINLDSTTGRYAGSGLATLPEHIDLARAALGPAPMYRRRGVDHVTLPRADVEVDVDMENVEDGVYLWGALVTSRTGSDRGSSYHSTVSWEPLNANVETENSLAFWRWLMRIRADAHRGGLSFRAYCYNASAENTYLRRLGLAVGIVDEVFGFMGSDEWVDLLRVVDRQLITGGSMGLKTIAPLSGFRWSVDDPGGGRSMLYYDIAVRSGDPTVRKDARAWLMTYNRGDVEATLAIRDWLDATGDTLPAVESLEMPAKAGQLYPPAVEAAS